MALAGNVVGAFDVRRVVRSGEEAFIAFGGGRAVGQDADEAEFSLEGLVEEGLFPAKFRRFGRQGVVGGEDDVAGVGGEALENRSVGIRGFLNSGLGGVTVVRAS